MYGITEAFTGINHQSPLPDCEAEIVDV